MQQHGMARRRAAMATIHRRTSHSIFQAAASGHSTPSPPLPLPRTGPAGRPDGLSANGARCAMFSRGPYSPDISTRLATVVRSRLAEKVCRQQRPLQQAASTQCPCHSTCLLGCAAACWVHLPFSATNHRRLQYAWKWSPCHGCLLHSIPRLLACCSAPT